MCLHCCLNTSVGQFFLFFLVFLVVEYYKFRIKNQARHKITFWSFIAPFKKKCSDLGTCVRFRVQSVHVKSQGCSVQSSIVRSRVKLGGFRNKRLPNDESCL